VELKQIGFRRREHGCDPLVVGIGHQRHQTQLSPHALGQRTRRLERQVAGRSLVENESGKIGARAHGRIGSLRRVDAADFHEKRHGGPLIAATGAEIKLTP